MPAFTPGQTVASYTSYVEAQRAVDALSDAEFPVEHVRIVGSDLHLIEQVTGRLNWWRAALSGLGTGAWIGLLIGLIIWIIAIGTGLIGSLLWGLFWGAVFGAVFGLASYAVTGGRRDFTSRSVTIPARYDIMVDTEVADRALQVLNSARRPAGRPE